MGKGECVWGGGDEGWEWGRGVKVQKFLLLMTIAESVLLGQSACGLNFYDDSGCSSLGN
jgi:hypothetical protein